MIEVQPPFASLLEPGEELLWSGQPKQGLLLQAGDAAMIPFSLMWGGFALFWEASVLGLVGPGLKPHGDQGPPLFMALWGIPFVLIGLYMIFGRFFYDAALRRTTWYGLTNRRLVIWKSLFGRNENSFDHALLANLNLVERRDGSGDILFGSTGSMLGNPPYGSRRSAPVPGFYLVPQAREVYSRIRAAQQQARK